MGREKFKKTTHTKPNPPIALQEFSTKAIIPKTPFTPPFFFPYLSSKSSLNSRTQSAVPNVTSKHGYNRQQQSWAFTGKSHLVLHCSLTSKASQTSLSPSSAGCISGDPSSALQGYCSPPRTQHPRRDSRACWAQQQS